MFKPYDHYGDRLNSYDLLKLLALAAMVLDHIGYYLMPDVPWLRAVGRVAFPLFLFLVGYSGVWTVKKDIFLWALVLTACNLFAYNELVPFTILVSIMLVRLVMGRLLKHFRPGVVLVAIFFAVCVLTYDATGFLDYNSIAFLFSMSGYLQRERPRSALTLIFLYMSMGFHYFVELTVFHDFFTKTDTAIMTLGLAVVLVLMHRFTIKAVPANWIPKGARRVLMWASRNTLHLYGIHVALIIGLACLLRH